MTVLIADGEDTSARILSAALRQAGFPAIVVKDGVALVNHLKHHEPDLLVIAADLPAADSLELCRQIRMSSSLPIILIVENILENRQFPPLEWGVDDVLSRPFNTSEAVARARALLRESRSRNVREKAEVRVGNLLLCQETRDVCFNGQRVRLTRNEFRLLSMLAESPNRVFSREALLDVLQGYGCERSDRAIDSHIKNIRRKLAAVRPELDVIQSVYGEGYRLKYPFQCSRRAVVARSSIY